MVTIEALRLKETLCYELLCLSWIIPDLLILNHGLDFEKASSFNRDHLLAIRIRVRG